MSCEKSVSAVLMCPHCFAIALCEWAADPYMADVYGEVEYSWWCDACFEECAADI